MRVVFLGWGSLIWAPATLAKRSRWHKDGPQLPLEFARRSRNGRLTLVIERTSAPQQTYWALSSHETIQAARENLADREGSAVAAIHWASRTEGHDVTDGVVRLVRTWLAHHSQIDAAIWTGLRGNLDTQDVFSAAVAYLKAIDVPDERYAKAREYVVKAPPQIQTPVRAEMRREGWADHVLPSDLFEP